VFKRVLKFNLVVDIVPGQGFWMATQPEFNLEARGDTPEEAMQNLRTYMLAASERPRNVLSKDPITGEYVRAVDTIAKPPTPPTAVEVATPEPILTELPAEPVVAKEPEAVEARDIAAPPVKPILTKTPKRGKHNVRILDPLEELER
jgi:hypothetical protein